ncbi:MAG: protein kinase domain-containing protein [Longimicrobiales bacterium]
MDLSLAARRALADRYTIDRELGSGGMATVYLARDLRHDRPVALKVLLPELAALIGRDRFLSEIKITAQLRHPHLVPLFDSGEADGQLFYVMPYLEGETLRERLQREGPLPVEEAIRIVTNIARALDYAHRQGVIHRDLKPENILLQDGEVMVADFGISLALSHAGGERLTRTGIALGTPEYMSPEQAAADARIDARSDIYSLGVLLYETLVGQPPYMGSSGAAIIARILTGNPVAPRTLRDTVPEHVNAAVLLALAKLPADRFGSAELFARALTSAAATPGGTRVLRWKPRARHILMASATITAAIIAYYALRAAGVRPFGSPITAGVIENRERLVLAGFHYPGGDTSWADGLTQAFRVGLEQSKTLRVVDQAEITRVLARMKREPGARIDRSLALEIAQREGIKAVVMPELLRAGGSYVLSARLARTDNGETIARAQATARDSAMLIEAVGSLSRQLRRRAGESLANVRASPGLERVTTQSLAALVKYSQAVSLIEAGRRTVAIEPLEAALAADSTFTMAWRSLAWVYTMTAQSREKVVDAATRAYAHRTELTERERLLTVAGYHQLVTQDLEQAAAAYESLLDTHQTDFAAHYNLAGLYLAMRNYEQSRAHYSMALQVDSTVPDVRAALAIVHSALGQYQDALRLFDEQEARFGYRPPTAHSRLKTLFSMGDENAVTEQLRQFHERAPDALARGVAEWTDADLAARRGQLARAVRHRKEGGRHRLEYGNILGPLQAELWIVHAKLTLAHDTERARSDLLSALSSNPLQSAPPHDRPYLPIVSLLIRVGQVEKARQLQAEYERTIAPELRGDTRQAMARIRAFTALHERRFSSAIEEFHAAERVARRCYLCEMGNLARAHDAAGARDSAIVYFERFLTRPSYERLAEEATEVGSALERLAELYEQTGNYERARHYAQRFVQLWRDADPEFQPRVAAKHQMLRRLRSS